MVLIQAIHSPAGRASAIRKPLTGSSHRKTVAAKPRIVRTGATGATARFATLPERECIVATVRGSYDQFSLAHDLIAEKIAKEGLRLPETSPVDRHAFNIYVTEMGEVPEDQLIAKIYQPVGN